jgi:hemerythrin-like domain-containing protein
MTTMTTNAVELLKSDHAKVKQLFAQFEAAGEDEKRKGEIFKTIAQELKVHTTIEEEVFYPAVKKMDSDMALEAEEEHNIVDWIIAQMKKLSPGDENYDAKFTTLKENVEHHIKEEEEEMFPEAEEKLGKQIDALGKKMLERKEALTKRSPSSSRAAAKPATRSRAASSTRSRKTTAGSR